MAPPTALVDDLVEVVLLRLPPDDPAQLLRAGLVCKRWRRLVSDAGFRRRFRSFHRRSPPMLGFFYRAGGSSHRIRFVPTSNSCPPIADQRCYRVLDARHGRVLLLVKPPLQGCTELAVWDPIAGERRDLPTLARSAGTYNASVLCPAGGTSCGSHSCHCKQFLVVFIGTDDGAGIFSCVYSSETGAWSEPISVQEQRPPCCIDPVAGTLAGNAVYFLIQCSSKILRYDLGTKAFSVIRLPYPCYDGYYVYVAPMATKDGVLGLVGVEDTRLHLWSTETDRNGQARWVERRTIELKKRIPVDPDRLFLMPDFVAIADGSRVDFLVVTTDGIFSIDLKTLKSKKVYEGFDAKNIVPFVGFYTPAQG